jgi:putative ABC transport system permease protein
MKRWFDPVRTAWVGITAHKLRSFLTILGVVIGVAAVITLMSIGKGTSATILSSFQSLGSDLLFVQSGATVTSGVRGAFGSAASLTLEDSTAIAEQVSNIESAAASSNTFLQVIAGDENIGSMITGITPEYQQVYKLELQEGSFISYSQYDSAQKVAILGSAVKETLFGEEDAIGQPIRLGSTVVRVVGVLESKGQSLMGSNDETILIPLTTLQQIFSQSRTNRGEHVVQSIAILVTDEKYITQITEEITELLRYRHQLALGVDDDFRITSVEQLTSTISEATGTLTLLLGAIAAISLLVGGIGVMNIMLVSVIERTREIGIRKALGAREREIWSQFVVEAAFMTLSGGIIGIIVGWGASRIIARLASLQTLVSADIVILAVGVSAAIGLFFGFYPAWQASRLNPIQALRHE